MENTLSNRRGSLELGAGGDPVPHEEADQRDGFMAAGGDHALGAAASTEAYFRAATAILAMRSGAFEPDTSAALLQRHYELTGSIATLSSEIERTAEVTLPDGRRLILKTSTRPEAVDSFRFQSAAMAGVQGAAGIVVPEVLCTSSGALMFEEEGVCGYLQTGIDGIPLHKATPTTDLLFRPAGPGPRADRCARFSTPRPLDARSGGRGAA
jgi:hypothetical protein